jgi:hypothetical protein
MPPLRAICARLVLLLGCSLCVCAPSAAQVLTIRAHEIAELTFDGRAFAAAADGPRGPRAASAAFTAFGRRFDLALESNERLIANLDATQRAALKDVELFRGTVAGVDGSWVRLTRTGGRVTGLLWDGAELYGIDAQRDLAPFLATAGGDPDATVIYRWSDVAGELGDAALPAAALASLAAAAPGELPGELGVEAASLNPGKQLDIGIVGDYEFVRDGPWNAAERAIEAVNNVDAILVRSLGLYLNLTKLELFETDTDPFVTNEPRDLLLALETHKETTPDLRGRGLVHLLTRRDLAEPAGATKSIVGIANIGSVCDVRKSVGLTQATYSSSMNALIMAHEIGHNLGAPHDGEAKSACASTPTTFLMAATINGSDEYSACSVQQMQPVILGAACLVAPPTADVAIRRHPASPNPLGLLLGGRGTLMIEGENAGPTDALAVDVTVQNANVQITRIDLFPSPPGGFAFQCSNLVAPFRCQIPRLPPGNRFTLSAELATVAPGPASLTFGTHAANDVVPGNDLVPFAIEVQSAVDVDATSTLTPTHIRPLGTTWASLDFTNQGTVAATEVRAQLNLPSQIELVDAARDGCTRTTTAWLCPIGAVGGHETKRLAIELRARAGTVGTQFGSFAWTAAQRDIDLGADNASLTIGVVPKIVDLAVSRDGPTRADPGAPVELVATLDNAGPDVADEVVFSYDNDGVTVQSATSSNGVCALTSPSSYTCRAPSLAPGESIRVTLRGTASTAASFFREQIGASTATYDADSANDVQQTAFDVTLPAPAFPPAPATSGAAGGAGGGGAFDPLLLGLCGWLWARKRARGRSPSLPSAL